MKLAYLLIIYILLALTNVKADQKIEVLKIVTGNENISPDHTEAIQTAVNKGGTIHLPEGRYIINKSILIKKTSRIIGSGRGTTILVAGDKLSDYIFRIANDTNEWMPFGTVSDLTFDGGKKGTARGAIWAHKITMWNFDRLSVTEFYNTKAIGINFHNVFQTAIRDTYIRLGSLSGGKKGEACFIIKSDNDIVHTTHITLDNVLFQYCGIGLYFSELGARGDSFTVRQSAVGNVDTAVRIEGNYRNMLFDQMLIENASNNGFDIGGDSSTKSVQLTGIRFWEAKTGVKIRNADKLSLRNLQFAGDDICGYITYDFVDNISYTSSMEDKELTAYSKCTK